MLSGFPNISKAAWIGVATACLLIAVLGKAAGAADDDFSHWLNGLWPDAQKIGVSRRGFDTATAGLKLDMHLPDLASAGAAPGQAQAEFIRPASGYLNEASIAKLAAAGANVTERWATSLRAIEAKYGVPGTVLVAIFGRETDYGAERPAHSVIQVLATEAYAGRRKEYFREQLLWAVKMVDDGDIAVDQFKGSWAGAFGLTQFMPTGYRDNAVDFEGTGRRDVWTSVPDALASSAVELSKAVDKDGRSVGWQRGVPWGFEVRLPAGIDCALAGFDRPKTIAEWQKLGLIRARGKAFAPGQTNLSAYLLLPEGTTGPAFLVTDNFLALKVYNYADLYALFVGHLADRIAGAPAFEKPWGVAPHMTEAKIFDLQNSLVGLGYDVGRVDGKIGWKMRNALGQFQLRAGLPQTCYPSEADASALLKTAASAQ